MATLTSAAKVNLTLSVVGRDRAGNHILQSLVAFADLCDRLDITLADESSTIRTNVDIGDNILQGILDDLSDQHNIPPLDIYLQKNIPMGAGLGGASADAATLLNYVAAHYSVSRDDLAKIAQRHGADIGVCQVGKPCWLQGVGEIVTPLTAFPSLACLIVYPHACLSTGLVFADYANGQRPYSLKIDNLPQAFSDSQSLFAFLKNNENDLWQAACNRMPALQEIRARLQSLHNIRHVGMSGSGSALIGLYETKHRQACQKAAESIQKEGYFARACRLGGC